MKKFFIVICFMCFGLPSLAYNNDFLAEIDAFIYFTNNNWAEFKNPDTKQVTFASYGNEGEVINMTFYKIDDTFCVSSRGTVINYKTGNDQDTKILNRP